MKSVLLSVDVLSFQKFVSSECCSVNESIQPQTGGDVALHISQRVNACVHSSGIPTFVLNIKTLISTENTISSGEVFLREKPWGNR